MATRTPLARRVKDVQDIGPKDSPVPEGIWEGTIEETRIRSLEYLQGRSQEELSKQGYTSDDVEVLSHQIGGLTPIDPADQPDQGNRKFFTPDIVVQDGQYSVLDDGIPGSAWQLSNSQDALFNMAMAMGEVEEVELDGEEAIVLTDGFLERLRANEFRGQGLGFDTYVRTYKKRDGSEGHSNEVRTYMPPTG